MLSSRLSGLFALGLPLLGAAGCSGDITPMREALTPVKEAMAPVKTAIKDAGYGPKAIETPDFVETSRRPGGTYMPVGQDEPRRAIRARTPEAQKSLQADLEGARTRNEARGKTAEGAAKGIAKGLKPAEPPAE